MCAGGPEHPNINAAHRWSNRRRGIRLRPLFGAHREASTAQRSGRVERLRKLAAELQADGVQVEIATDLERFSTEEPAS